MALSHFGRALDLDPDHRQANEGMDTCGSSWIS